MPLDIKKVVSNQEDDNSAEIAESAAEMADIKQRSVKGVLSYVGRSFATFGVTLVAQLLLAAFLSPEEFGVYYIVTAVLGLFTFLSDVGLASALIQKKSEPTVQEMRTTFTVQQLLSIAIFVIVVALTPYWQSHHDLFGHEMWLLYLVAGSFFFISFKTIPSVLLARALRFDLLALPAVVENVVFYIIATVLAWKGFGIQSFFWAIIARDVLGIGLMYYLQSWPIGVGIWRKSLKDLLNFGFKFQLNDLLARIKDDLFTLVIVAAWLDKGSLGYIAWAKKNSSIPQQFTVNNVTAITFPTYARLQHSPELLKKAIEKTLYFITLVAFPMLVGMCVFVGPLVQLIPRYNKWQPAVLSFILFGINIAWSTLSTPLTNTLSAIGHVNKTLWLMVMWTVLTWTVTPLCIYWFGYNGVAIASAIIGASSVVTIWMVQQVVPFGLTASIWRQSVASICMAIIGVLGLSWWSQSFFHVFVGMILTTLTFAIVFLAIGRKSLENELKSLGIWPRALRFLQW